ncbi:molecular chaperone TorD family protein [Halomonas sp. JS92-SW72]|uniref:TorD/DmsD family molecular chaperone n=1 Tax=Halomonas sp. JS92-SW72 TaxID=2306583 RepID=UPI000E5C385C|nr:molecular chaperone TorD family protein [Halomonas sp. JS92-SW72]AXY41526.1 molecular chaperone TorD [Halomonas sp. JS92-SW72]
MHDNRQTVATLNEREALRADIYRLLARLLLAPPDAELLDFLAHLEPDEEGGEMSAAWRELADAARTTSPEAAARAHFELLVGVIQGEITPYASWYLHGTLMDEPLVALRRDLRRLGIARAEESRDPEDHLGALLEVMALLVEGGTPDQAVFFHRHLASWAQRCLGDLARVHPPIYAGSGRLGLAFLAQERQRFEAMAEESPVRMIDPAAG